MARVKQFDVDGALEKAGETFWERGFEATTLSDLLDSMGIQKGSFYATYGSKREAYLRALEQYTSQRYQELVDRVRGFGPVPALRTLFEWFARDCTGDGGRRGCFIINCALEVAHEDAEAQAIVQKNFKAYERLFRNLIAQGQEDGDIEASIDAPATAKTMMAIVIGMRVFARSGAPRSTIEALAHQAGALLDG
jgi:TetR/AcrR family transcriptional repressor of nem operon